MDEKIGQAIASARKSAGLEQKELSEALTAKGLNWSQGTLSRVETGDRPVRLSEVVILQEVLRLDANKLLSSSNDLFTGAVSELESEFKTAKEAWSAAEVAMELVTFHRDVARIALYLAENRDFKAIVHGVNSQDFYSFELAVLNPALPVLEATYMVCSELLRRNGQAELVAQISTLSLEDLLAGGGESLGFLSILGDKPDVAKWAAGFAERLDRIISLEEQDLALEQFLEKYRSVLLSGWCHRLLSRDRLYFRADSDREWVEFEYVP